MTLVKEEILCGTMPRRFSVDSLHAEITLFALTVSITSSGNPTLKSAANCSATHSDASTPTIMRSTVSRFDFLNRDSMHLIKFRTSASAETTSGEESFCHALLIRVSTCGTSLRSLDTKSSSGSPSCVALGMRTIRLIKSEVDHSQHVVSEYDVISMQLPNKRQENPSMITFSSLFLNVPSIRALSLPTRITSPFESRSKRSGNHLPFSPIETATAPASEPNRQIGSFGSQEILIGWPLLARTTTPSSNVQCI
mmetsp:Transcript_25391/g.36443  ORF Transcript_25391/g.36443 Transcript_25391/m.36443 type:complete len:253 (-) Transcript_25391:1051-1809(-)